MTGTAAAGPPFEQLRRMRILGRLTTAYLLDTIAIARGREDPIDSLLAAAIVQANVAEITHRAEAQEAYVVNDEVPSDDVRRPVSVNAIAVSLGLPFETVRRRVNKMLRTGFCRAVDGGVIVPSSMLATPLYVTGAFQSYERLRAFYYQLRDFRLLDRLPEPTVELSANNFPVRTVSRLVGAYVLRVIETMGLHGDIIDGMVLLEIFRSNVEALPQDRPGIMTDDERRPVSVNAAAARLGLPSETVRRRVADLIERGVVERVRGGVIVPTRILSDPRLAAALSANAMNLHRLVTSLARLGVLKVWDDLNPPVAEAEAV